MSELTLFLIKISYLAILWIFVLSAISVVRSDMAEPTTYDHTRHQHADEHGNEHGNETGKAHE